MPRLDRVNLAVESRVLAVRVAEQARLERRVVEGRVELRPRDTAAAPDEDRAELPVPGGGGARSDRFDAPGVRLGGEVAKRALRAHIGDRDLHPDPAVPRG